MITPGPWVATRDEHAPKAYRITGIDALSSTGSQFVRTIARVEVGAPAAANAQLLAAAPELLAALKAMLAPVGLGVRMSPKQRTAELAKRAELARTAIAKAEAGTRPCDGCGRHVESICQRLDLPSIRGDDGATRARWLCIVCDAGAR